MKYQAYSVKDFVLDEHFQQWVLREDPEATNFWENWLHQNPSKKEMVEEARALILEMDFEKTTSTPEEYREVWQKIDKEVEQYEESKQADAPVYQLQKRASALYKVAAVFIGFALVSAVYFLSTNYNKATTYTTAYGEVKEIILPDSSVVTLNANSTLTIAEEWGLQQTREVWLEGEAFFEVHEYISYDGHGQSAAFKSKLTKAGNSLPALVKFVVHAGEVNVAVLGTAFNVNNRRGNTKVVLNSGKIQLSIADEEITENILMEQGEMVAYNRANRQLQKQVVMPETYSSWRNNELIFDKVPLGEIAKILEDNYGLEVVFEDSAMMQRQFIGSLPSDNLDILLTAFSRMYNISREGEKVIFQKEH